MKHRDCLLGYVFVMGMLLMFGPDREPQGIILSVIVVAGTIVWVRLETRGRS